MKKSGLLLLLSSFALLGACSQAGASASSEVSYPSSQTASYESGLVSIDDSMAALSESEISSSDLLPISSASTAFNFDTYVEKYGSFSIDDGAYGSHTYDAETNTYTLAVASSKAEYTLTGAFLGTIVVDNVNELSSYKGVKITFAGAALVSKEDAKAAIIYKLKEKNVEIKSKKGTENEIVNRGSAAAVFSYNNMEFSGGGNLTVTSISEEEADAPHTFEAKGKITISGSSSIQVIDAAHDAFHGEKLTFQNDDAEKFTGTIEVHNCASQAFDFEKDDQSGQIEVQGGTINVDGADSVFKTDAALTLGAAAKVSASNIREEAVVCTGDEATFAYQNAGQFLLDGVPYTR